MENLKVYVDSKYDLGDIVIFIDTAIGHTSLKADISMGIITDIEAKIDKSNNKIYIEYTIINDEFLNTTTTCLEDNIIMTITKDQINNFKNKYNVNIIHGKYKSGDNN